MPDSLDPSSDALTLAQARRRAKALLAAVRRGDATASARLVHPHAVVTLSDAQHTIAVELGFGSWPHLTRGLQRFGPADLPDVDWRRIREISVVCFLDQLTVVLQGRQGRLGVPHGQPAAGEDVWDDTVRRVSLETVGFRHDSTHVFAIDVDRRHAVFWVDGDLDDRTSVAEAGRAGVTYRVDDALAALHDQGDRTLAQLVSAASDHRRTLTFEQDQRDGDRTTTHLYLRASTPQGGSGYSGSDDEWRAARSGLVVALEGLGTDLGRPHDPLSFLDVGCANGHLPASFVVWAAERGFAVDPYGVDRSAELVERAKKIYPHWADHFWTGNMLTWQHPEGRTFDLVHVLLDVLPPAKFEQAVSNCRRLVTPGGRLLVSVYGMRPELAPDAVVAGLGLSVDGRTPPRSRQQGRPGQPSVWTTVEGIEMHRSGHGEHGRGVAQVDH